MFQSAKIEVRHLDENSADDPKKNGKINKYLTDLI